MDVHSADIKCSWFAVCTTGPWMMGTRGIRALSNLYQYTLTDSDIYTRILGLGAIVWLCIEELCK